MSVTTHSLPILKERKRVLDVAWLTTQGILLAGVALPWFLRLVEVDVGGFLAALLAFVIGYAVASRGIDAIGNLSWFSTAVVGLNSLSVCILGVLWYRAGGTENMIFALAFVVPVIVSGLLPSRWLPYGTAALGTLVATVSAAAYSNGLRWYLARLGLPIWLPGSLVPDPTIAVGSQSGWSGHPARELSDLVFLALLLLCAALTTQSVSRFLVWLSRRLHSSESALIEARGLSEQMIAASPHPSALLVADTLQVSRVSPAFTRQLLPDGGGAVGRSLLEAIDFTHPEMIQECVAGGGGTVPMAMYRLGGEQRVAKVTLSLLERAEIQYVLFTLEDTTAQHHLTRSLDAVSAPHVTIDGADHVVYRNAAAGRLFDVEPGDLAVEMLEPVGTTPGWWVLGPRTRHERKVRVGDRTFGVELVAAPLPGEDARLVHITLQPEARR